MNTVLSVKNLSKHYGQLKAVDDISFTVTKGEVFGLLGENGAGKTTTLEMLEGLRQSTAGKIEVLGLDCAYEMAIIKQRIGVQLQSSAYYDFLTLYEILQLFGGFYRKSLEPSQLLKMVNLEDKANSYVRTLSGGQKQRFSIVASLVNDPELLFLDEPTTGLDPFARRNLWEVISDIKEQGKSIVLTTHYMEEAEVLCDRIAIMDQGRIVADGRTYELVKRVNNPFKITFLASKITLRQLDDLRKNGEIVELAGKSHHFEGRFATEQSLDSALAFLQKLHPEDLHVGRASLEDLFLEITGKKLEDQ